MRYKLMEIMAEEEGLIMYNPLTIDWSSFLWEQGYFPHKITKSEILKPYYISFQYYNTTIYYDIILLLNNIGDIFEVPPGTEIMIPKLDELKTFILNNRK